MVMADPAARRRRPCPPRGGHPLPPSAPGSAGGRVNRDDVELKRAARDGADLAEAGGELFRNMAELPGLLGLD